MSARIFGEGSSFALSPRLVARGDSTKLVLQAGSQKSIDEFGAQQLTRTWKCRTDLAPSFEPQYGDFDVLYRTFRVWDWSVEHGDHWLSTITVKYNGLVSASELLEKRDGDLVERTVSLESEPLLFDTTGPRTCTITYKAPQTTFRYALDAEPEQPRFAGELLTFSGAYVILNRTGDRLGGPVRVVHRALGKVKNFGGYVAAIRAVQTSFKKAQQGHIWQITEVNEGRILPFLDLFFAEALGVKPHDP